MLVGPVWREEGKSVARLNGTFPNGVECADLGVSAPGEPLLPTEKEGLVPTEALGLVPAEEEGLVPTEEESLVAKPFSIPCCRGSLNEERGSWCQAVSIPGA